MSGPAAVMSQCAPGPGVSLCARECVRLFPENCPGVASASHALPTPTFADPFHAMCSRARIRHETAQGGRPCDLTRDTFTTAATVRCWDVDNINSPSDRGHCLQRCSLTDAERCPCHHCQV